MTARVRSNFFGSSGFVATRPVVRVVGSRCVGVRSVAEQVGAASHHPAAERAASSVALAA